MLRINNTNILLPNFRPYEYIWQKLILPNDQTTPHITTDEHLAKRAYQISGLLWHTSFTKQEIVVQSNEKLSETARSYRTALELGQLPLSHHHMGREWLEKHVIDIIIDTAEGLRAHIDRPSSHHQS